MEAGKAAIQLHKKWENGENTVSRGYESDKEIAIAG